MTHLSLDYGGKRAYLFHLRSRALAAAGFYWRFGGADLDPVGRLIFVCKGNICRSPYARAYASTLGLDADSAGLAATPGTPANEVAASVARSRGISLESHRSKLLTGLALNDSDLVVVFEPAHARAVRQALADRPIRVRLLGLFMTPPYPYLHDPYGLTERYFAACFSRVEKGITNLAALLRHEPQR